MILTADAGCQEPEFPAQIRCRSRSRGANRKPIRHREPTFVLPWGSTAPATKGEAGGRS